MFIIKVKNKYNIYIINNNIIHFFFIIYHAICKAVSPLLSIKQYSIRIHFHCY